MQDITVRLTIQGEPPSQEQLDSLFVGTHYRMGAGWESTINVVAAQLITDEPSIAERIALEVLVILAESAVPLTLTDISALMGMAHGIPGIVVGLISQGRVRSVELPANGYVGYVLKDDASCPAG